MPPIRQGFSLLPSPPAAKEKRPRTAEAFDLDRSVAYFSELLIEVKLVFSLLPRPLTAAIIASEMPAAMRPYSMAVAPDSSFTKRAIRFFIAVTPCEHVAGRTNCGLAGVLSTVTMKEP